MRFGISMLPKECLSSLVAKILKQRIEKTEINVVSVFYQCKLRNYQRLQNFPSKQNFDIQAYQIIIRLIFTVILHFRNIDFHELIESVWNIFYEFPLQCINSYAYLRKDPAPYLTFSRRSIVLTLGESVLLWVVQDICW